MKLNDFSEHQWKKKHLVLKENQLRFMGNTVPTDSIRDLDTPIQYFLYSFLKILSKLYTAQSDINDLFRVSEIDIQQFIGVIYMMSLVQLPCVTSHWSGKMGTHIIQEVMTKNKFENIRRRLHFNDNSKTNRCVPLKHETF